MMGFLEKLRAERKGQQETGLVWAGDPALDEYYQRRYPRVRTISRAAATRTSAHAEGREAGKSLRRSHKGASTAPRGRAAAEGCWAPAARSRSGSKLSSAP
ncbi:MAG: hypothetical protein IPN17_18180 [Deltaproteobacteria bacterium]|nr:hypothetical protein [Deltaproteobacteria bacterium]